MRIPQRLVWSRSWVTFRTAVGRLFFVPLRFSSSPVPTLVPTPLIQYSQVTELPEASQYGYARWRPFPHRSSVGTGRIGSCGRSRSHPEEAARQKKVLGGPLLP